MIEKNTSFPNGPETRHFGSDKAELGAVGYDGPDRVLSGEWAFIFSSSARASRLAQAFDVLELAIDRR